MPGAVCLATSREFLRQVLCWSRSKKLVHGGAQGSVSACQGSLVNLHCLGVCPLEFGLSKIPSL